MIYFEFEIIFKTAKSKILAKHVGSNDLCATLLLMSGLHCC